jgi:hypothetical protein
MEWTMDIGAQALSIQEALYPELTRFGCGHANPDGFHLRSYRDGQVTVATFTPRAEHDNGFGFLNGGIVTTVLDYHTAGIAQSVAGAPPKAARHGAMSSPGYFRQSIHSGRVPVSVSGPGYTEQG